MSELVPAPGIILVDPHGEQQIGDIVLPATTGSGVLSGKVISIGPPRGVDDVDLQDMGLDKDACLYYTPDGARDIGECTAVDQGCILSWAS